MLRRAGEKRVRNEGFAPGDGKKQRIRRERKNWKALGSRKEKDDAEKVLEKLVLGGEEELLEQLTKPQPTSASIATRQHEQKKGDKELKPAWEDEDDKELKIPAHADKQMPHAQHKKHEKQEEVSASKYTANLKAQFEKVSGTPAWAKLRREKSPTSDDESDSEDLLKTTGNFLTGSQFLPKGILQIKKCTDANREAPSTGKLKSVEFHPSAQVVLTAGMDHTLNLFQVDGKNNPKIQSVFLDRFPIFTAHFSSDGKEVIMGSKHKNFYYYDMMEGKVVNVPQIKGLEEKNMSRFRVSPDGRMLVFLGKYGHIHLLSAQSKEWISTLKMNGSVDALAFSREGERMFSFGDDGEVYVWDMTTRDCIHRFTDDGCVQGTAMAASANGQYLACGSYSGVVNVYDTESCLASHTPKPLKAVMNLTTPCTATAFNTPTELLAVASNYTERAIRMIHLPSLTAFSNFPDKTESMRIPLCMDFSLHSGYFVVGDHKGQASLYRIKHYGNY